MARVQQLTRPQPNALSTPEVAELFHCSAALVRKLVVEGILKPINTPSFAAKQNRAHWFDPDEVNRLRQMPAPEFRALREAALTQQQRAS